MSVAQESIERRAADIAARLRSLCLGDNLTEVEAEIATTQTRERW